MNHVLHGCQILPWEGAILRGGGQANHFKVLGHSAVICANTTEPIEVPFGLWARMRQRHQVLDGVQTPHGKGQFWRIGAPISKYMNFISAVSCAKKAEPIDLPFGLWTRQGRRMHMFNRIRQVAPMCPHWRSHCRHLANTIEPSVYGGDAPFVKLLG